jgi:uncharacterized protein involved in oxidation of intracellular sulfur
VGRFEIEEKAKQYLLIVNDGPYGSERPYSALRIAMNLAKQESTTVRVFLIGDGVQCVLQSQETHQGYYNIERMMSSVAGRGEVGMCRWSRAARQGSAR